MTRTTLASSTSSQTISTYPGAAPANDQWSPLDNRLVRKAMRVVRSLHVLAYRATNGRYGMTEIDGAPVCLLTTIGRNTGQRRTTSVPFFQDGERVVLVACQPGRREHPQWYRNLTSEPKVDVQIGDQVRTYRARTASTEERVRMAGELVSMMHLTAEEQQSWSRRVIPVVVLEPQ